jgi:hypothetical protein
LWYFDVDSCHLGLVEQRLRPHSKDRPESPRCGNAKHQHESQIDQMLRCASFAPGLEHSDESYKEQNDRQHRQTLQQHGFTPSLIRVFRNSDTPIGVPQ